jgi:RimJ/RimL family protein N-acetyltransferase
VTRSAAAATEHLVIARTPRLRIRARIRSDADDEFRWRSDPDLAHYDGAQPRIESFEQFLQAFSYDLAFGHVNREAFALDTADALHIGTIMYYNADLDSAELGLSIAIPEFWGGGYGREAITAFLRFIWAQRSFRRIYLHALAWNERAIRSFQAAGFELTSTVDRNGQAFVRMDARREFWLLADSAGRFDFQRAR